MVVVRRVAAADHDVGKDCCNEPCITAFAWLVGETVDDANGLDSRDDEDSREAREILFKLLRSC